MSHIFRVRWPQGYECFRCSSEAPPWVTSRGYLHCRQCGSEISVTAGTVFERTRKALAGLVSSDMARDEPEARGQRTRSSACTWSGQLPDGLDLVAQVEARHGQARP